MALILNIETSTEVCSVCLQDGPDLLTVEEILKGKSHTALITVMIDKCFSDSGKDIKDLDAVAVSSGPGSYTGLRVGVSTAKGICFGLNVPLISVDTLYALANVHDVDDNSLVVPMIDARRMEVYTKMYDSGMNEVKPIHNLILDEDSFASFEKSYHNIIITGNGAEKCKALFSGKDYQIIPSNCSSRNMISKSYEEYQKKNFVDLSDYSPLYYKSPNITKPKQLL